MVGVGNSNSSSLNIQTDGNIFTSPSTDYNQSNSSREINPYWLNALIADQIVEDGFLQVVNSTNGFKYMFPETKPSYVTNEIDSMGWVPVNDAVKIAARNIFENIEKLLPFSFIEVFDSNNTSVISIMSNEQKLTTGYAYSPIDVLISTDNYVFSDVFISTENQNPTKSGNSTNFDYELLLHEIGHAIGLKHPFTSNTGDNSLMPWQEENNQWTNMSYTFNRAFFEGELKMLDKAALVNIYGINPLYESSNDIYYFSPVGQVIIDGSGIDTISAKNQIVHAYIDLRNNSQSYVGEKSIMITAPFQISVGDSIIENAEGGNGNDWIVGNSLPNTLDGFIGNDVIYGGDGADTIIGGVGNDIIDLTEKNPSRDTVKLETNLFKNGNDTLISFEVGSLGDFIKIDNISDYIFLEDLIDISKNEINLSQKICRHYDSTIKDAETLKESFEVGNLSGFQTNINSSLIMIIAENILNNGDHKIFYVEKNNNDFQVTQIITMQETYADLSSWSENNFI